MSSKQPLNRTRLGKVGKDKDNTGSVDLSKILRSQFGKKLNKVVIFVYIILIIFVVFRLMTVYGLWNLTIIVITL